MNSFIEGHPLYLVTHAVTNLLQNSPQFFNGLQGIAGVFFISSLEAIMLRKIKVLVWTGDVPEERKIWAWVDGGLALHPNIADPYMWTITHINSGYAIKERLPKWRVIDEYEKHKKLNINGVLFSDLPACEALTYAPLIQKRLGFSESKTAHWRREYLEVGINYFHCTDGANKT